MSAPIDPWHRTSTQWGIHVAVVLAFASLWLPWRDFAILRRNPLTSYGYQNEMVLLCCCFIYPFLAARLNRRLIKPLGVLCGAVPGVWAVWNLVTVWPLVRIGMFVFLAGSALLLGMAPAYRQVKELPPDGEGGEGGRW
jgi:hypothetical protein